MSATNLNGDALDIEIVFDNHSARNFCFFTDIGSIPVLRSRDGKTVSVGRAGPGENEVVVWSPNINEVKVIWSNGSHVFNPSIGMNRSFDSPACFDDIVLIEYELAIYDCKALFSQRHMFDGVAPVSTLQLKAIPVTQIPPIPFPKPDRCRRSDAH